MTRKETVVLSSTVEWGAIGKPVKLWPEEVVVGLEAIAWRRLSLDRLLNGQNESRVHGLHGRTGSSSNCLCLALDRLIIPSSLLIKCAGKVDYILAHEEEVKKRWSLFKKMRTGQLLIENGTSKGSLGRTVDLVEDLRGVGVKVGLMFDLAHEYKVGGGDWNELIKRYGEVTDRGVLAGIHLPFGTYEGDSLPFEKMTNQEWQSLADVIIKSQLEWLVIEMRNAVPDSFLLTQGRIPELRKRNEEILERLAGVGIIS